MNVCGTTRLLIPGFLVGLAVATFTGHDLYGWIAAALTVGVLYVIQSVRGTNQSCAIPGPASTQEVSVDDTRPTDASSH